MISTNCDVNEFYEAVKDQHYLDIIQLADSEATAAERGYFTSRSKDAADERCGKQYSEALKELINLLRFAVKPKSAEKYAFLANSVNNRYERP